MNRKTNLFISLLLFPFIGFCQSATSFDVRSVRWGMSQDSVMIREGRQPDEISPILLVYKNVEIGPYVTTVRYSFLHDQLNKVELILSNAHFGYKDFPKVDSLLIERYGKPAEKVNRSFAPNKKMRADTAMSIFQGYHTLYTSWKTDRTLVYHSVDNFRGHLISYQPVQAVTVPAAKKKDF